MKFKTSKFSNIPNKNLVNRLDSLLGTVNSVFHKNNLNNIKYYIAGGSVLNAVKNINTESIIDIDIFFYDSDSFLIVNDVLKKAIEEGKKENENVSPILHHHYDYIETSNASTFIGLDASFNIQIIKKEFGEVEEMLSGFDLIQSMCAVTSNRRFIANYDITKPLIVNDKKINGSTYQRYNKYVNVKGCEHNENEINKIFDYLIENAFEEMMHGDSGSTTMSQAYKLLKYSSESECQYIHNKIFEKHNKENRLLIYKSLVKKNALFNIAKMCNEFIVAAHLFIEESSNEGIQNYLIPFYNHYQKHKSSAVEEYPEYFI